MVSVEPSFRRDWSRRFLWHLPSPDSLVTSPLPRELGLRLQARVRLPSCAQQPTSHRLLSGFSLALALLYFLFYLQLALDVVYSSRQSLPFDFIPSLVRREPRAEISAASAHTTAVTSPLPNASSYQLRIWSEISGPVNPSKVWNSYLNLLL